MTFPSRPIVDMKAVYRWLESRVAETDPARVAAALLGLSTATLLLGKAVFAAVFALAVLAALPALRDGLIRGRFRALLAGPVGWLGLGVLAWWLLSSAFSQAPYASFEVVARMALFIAAALLLLILLAERADLRRLAEGCFLAAFTTTACLGAAAIYGAPEIATLLRPFNPDVGDPIALFKSQMSVFAVATPVAIWIGWRRGGAWWALALVGLIATGFMVWGDGREPGRSATAGLAAAFAAVMIVRGVRSRTASVRRTLAAVLIGAGAVATLAVFLALPSPPLDEHAIDDPPLPILDFHRQAIWGFSFDLALDRPMLGYGINTINTVAGAGETVPGLNKEFIPSHPHNWMLEVMAETGVPGLLLLLASQLLLALVLARGILDRRAGAYPVLAVLAAFWTSSLANFSIWSAWWQVAFLATIILPGARLIGPVAAAAESDESVAPAGHIDWRRAAALGVAIFLALALALVWYARRTESGYILYKRLKADSPYLYEEIRPALEAVDPGALIRIDGADSEAAIRADLRRAVWGEAPLPAAKLPAQVETVPSMLDAISAGGSEAARIERITISVGGIFRSVGYVLVPGIPNGRGVVYAHGYAGTIRQAVPLAQALLKSGFTVAMLNFANYGQSRFTRKTDPRFGPVSYDHDFQLYFADRPMRFYIEPAIVAANHLRAAHGLEAVDAVGFSAGGWVSGVAAALDPRFERAVSVAAYLPFYLRRRGDPALWPAPHLYPPLIQAANYLEIPVLAAAGPGRAYLQIFNRYDRCCYRNRYGTLYQADVEAAARRTGAGAFGVAIDETHAEHAISSWARGRIVDFLVTGEIRPAERHAEPPRNDRDSGTDDE